ncbi:biopolymer transporter ExbD [Bacterioplanes sanyensis]|uniref:Biopolymer transporter ExbD n=1 Tax=Bacterioplanes sanyensis TaxID=1249553 RepID=A0A222FP37_9GAMM|nr:biopolymer transporter ExbD [Bacterioplanes sanyensis]ASP39983.1 biopolymer transporter ExbD [Bacterioplanes sanyensis]
MNFKRQNREPVEVNLTPLIDIVFLLLIFFMVSTTFTKENHLNLDLPEASAEAASQPDAALEIIINAQGDYSINNQALVNQQLDTLKRGLQKALAGRSDAPVIITADANTPHQAVVRAMDAAGQVGLVNLSITTRQPRSER